VRLDAVSLVSPQHASAQPWVIYFQGNAGSLRRPRVQGQLRTLHDLGYNVLSFDYRGYGRSDGEPSEAGLYEDGRAAYDHLIATGVSPERIILAGQSLGSAVAVELATRVRSAGVALFSPIDSVPLTAGRLYPWVPVHYLATNRFDSSAKIDRLHVPIVVFHSAYDRLIPLQAARELFDKITAPKRMIETGGGHNGAGFEDIEALRATMWEFWPPAADDRDEEVVSTARAALTR
jgi:pimeloyl-ACP methyl ester carboxylesterase